MPLPFLLALGPVLGWVVGGAIVAVVAATVYIAYITISSLKEKIRELERENNELKQRIASFEISERLKNKDYAKVKYLGKDKNGEVIMEGIVEGKDIADDIKKGMTYSMNN